MEELKQFSNLSSWREDNVAISAGEVKELDFTDTTPNTFVIQNGTNSTLKVAISKYPTKTNYEFKIGSNTSSPFGRPTATRKIYILNDSSSDVVVKVFSVFTNFDINILKDMNVVLDNAIVQSDGVIKGFESGVELPPGDNQLGSVNFGDLATVKVDKIISGIADLIQYESNKSKYETGGNTINFFDIFTLIQLMKTSLETQLENLNVATSTDKIITDIYKCDGVGNTLLNFAGITPTSEFTQDTVLNPPFCPNRLILLTNDGNEDIKVEVLENNGTSVLEKSFTLKPGESLSNIAIKVPAIFIKSNGIAKFRYVGGKA